MCVYLNTLICVCVCVVNTSMIYVIKLYKQYVLFLIKFHRTLRTVFPQEGGVCNNPWLIFHVNKIRLRSWNTYSKLNGGENITLGSLVVY